MTETTFSVRGLNLCLSAWGPTSGPLVICLHGFLDQGASWRSVGEDLAERGYRVVAPDARGMGRSDHVGVGGYYHFVDYLGDLDAIAAHLTDAPFALVGHSMGGAVASMYAGLRPQRVGTHVNVEGLGIARVSDSAAIGQLSAHLTQISGPPTQPLLRDLDDAVSRMRRHTPELPEPEARRLAERVTVVADAGLRWRWDPLHRTRGGYAFDADRYRVLLTRIAAPTMLVSGGRSKFRLDKGSTRGQAIAICRHTLLPSGHNPHIECPGRLADTIHAAVEWSRATSRGEQTA